MGVNSEKRRRGGVKDNEEKRTSGTDRKDRAVGESS